MHTDGFYIFISIAYHQRRNALLLLSGVIAHDAIVHNGIVHDGIVRVVIAPGAINRAEAS